MTLYRKLKTSLGRKVSSVLRNYPWPVKKKVLSFPPISAGEGERQLVVLTHQRMWLESLWCCWSWMRQLSGAYRLELFIDGEIPEYLSTAFARLFPGGRLRDVREVQLPADLITADMQQFIRDDVYGRKVSMILESQRHADIVFSDADVLVFRRPTEMLGDAGRPPQLAYNYEQHTYCNDWVREKLRSADIDILKGFNSGLLTIPRASLDLDLANRIIEGWPEVRTDIWVEQSMFNGLFSAAGARQLSPEHYSVSWQGMWWWQKDIDYEPLHVRHFCGVVRHRMFLQGMPYLQQLISNEKDSH